MYQVKKGILYLLTLLILSLNFDAEGQNPEWIRYSGGMTITSIADEGNHLWLGTDDGVVKFNKVDGTLIFYNTSNSSLPDNDVYSISIDASGDKWIGTWKGLAKFDNSTWTVYDTSNSPLPADYVAAVAVDNNDDKWIGTCWFFGLAKYDDVTWTIYNTSNSGLPNNCVRSLAVDVANDKWIGTNGGVAHFNDVSWVVYDTSNSGLPMNQTNAITIDPGGNKWFGTEGGGLTKFDGSTWTVYNTSNSGLPDNDVNAIAIDGAGNKWIATNNGLAKFDGSTWTVYDISNTALESDYCQAILVDPNGDKWVGNSMGIAKFDDVTWEIYHTNIGHSNLQDITIDQYGNKWTGSGWFSGGLSKFTGSTCKLYNQYNSSLPDNAVSHITFDSAGDQWIATQAGMVLRNNTSWTIYDTSNSGIPNDKITAVELDSLETKWIATNFGLAKFDGSTWVSYNTGNSGLPKNLVRCIDFDLDGSKWIGTNGAGIARFDDSTWTVYDTSNSGLAHVNTIFVHIDSIGNKWIGSLGGLSKFNDTSWTTYDTSNSPIPHNYVRDMAIDKSGMMWIATDGGLAKFDNTTWTVFNFPAGYPFSNMVAIDIDENDNKWMASWGGGLYVFKEGGVELPPVTSFTADKNVICIGDSVTFTDQSTNAPFAWSWLFPGGNPSTSTIQNPIITYSTPGTYDVTLTITNLNGSDSTVYSNYIAIASPAISKTVSNISCNGYNDGAIDLTISGAYAPYSFIWTSGDTLEDRVGLSPGTYAVTVTDAIGCSSTDNSTITEPLILTDSIIGTDVLCQNGFDGSANLTVSGGTLPFTYSWSNGDSIEDPIGLAAGTYFVTISDSNNCTINDSVIISTSTSTLTVALVPTNIACNGANNGSIDLTILSGSAPYTFLWSTGDTTEDVTTLSIGLYSVTVMNSSGCVSDSATIGEPPALLLTPGSSPDINGSGVGMASANASGGTPPYSYLWDDPLSQTTGTAINLAAGSYSVTITDGNGCLDTGTVTVTGLFTALTYQKTFGGANEDIGNCISLTSDGGFIIGGSTMSYGPWLINKFLIKTNAYGDTLWTKVYANSQQQDYIKRVRQTPDGGYIIMGNETVSDAQISLIKTDSLGAVMWSRSYGGTNQEFAASLDFTSDGGYIITGYTRSYGIGSNEVYLFKTDALGNLLWTKTFGAAGSDFGEAVAQTSDNGFIITGHTTSYGLGNDVYCIKTDSAGNLMWSKTYGGTLVDWGFGLIQTNDGGYIFTGTTQSFNPGAYEMYVIRTNSIGDTLWTRRYGGQNDEAGYSIIQSSNGKFVIAGYKEKLFTGGGLKDAYLIKIDSAGDTLWTRSYGGTADDVGYSVKQTQDGGFAITGYTKSFGSGDKDIYLIKTDSMGNSGCSEYFTATNVRSSPTQINSGAVVGSGGTASNSSTGVFNPSIDESLVCNTCNITVSSVATQVTCNGGSDGTINLTVAGGVFPLTYTWSSGDSTEDITNVSAGSYLVYVTDSNQCVQFDTITITEPISSISSIVGTDILCSGDNNGSIDLAVSDSTMTYSYLWSNGDTIQDLSGLGPGTYSVLLTDTISCVSTASTTIVEPFQLNTSIVGGDVTCVGMNDGAADLFVTGGVLPYGYNWSTGDTIEDLSNLTGGTYSVIVSDSNNCMAYDTIALIDTTIPSSVSYVVTDVTCEGNNDGSIVLTVDSGIPPYSYLWSTGVTNNTAWFLTAGTYSVTVTDSSGCSIVDSFLIQEPVTGMTFSLSTVDPECNGYNTGSIDLTVSGGSPPYAYLWSNNDTTEDLSGLTAGFYGVSVTDQTGCSRSYAWLSEPPPIVMNLNSQSDSTGNGSGMAWVDVSGSFPPFQILWGPPSFQTSDTIFNLTIGNYKVEITDSVGCKVSDSLWLTGYTGAITFQKTFGGLDEDYGHSIQQTSDGGYILVGYTKSFGAGGSDIYLIKTDVVGDTLWTRTYGGTDDDRGYSVRQTNDQGYIITGQTMSFGSGWTDVILLKTDSVGNVMWTKIIGSIYSESGNDVKQTSDGGYIIAGASSGYGAQVGSQDFYLIRTNSTGDVMWTKTYGGPDNDFARAVQQTSDGGFIIAGNTRSYGAGLNDYYIIRTDNNGDTIWTKTFGGTGAEDCSAVEQLADDGFILAGNTWSFGPGYYGVYLIRLNSNGDTIWTKTYGQIDYESASSILVTSSGEFVVVGTTSSIGFGGFDVLVMKLDSNGTPIWTRAFGSNNNEFGHSISSCSDGGYAILAETDGFGAGNWDMYMIKTDEHGNIECNGVYANVNIGSSQPYISSQGVTDSGGIVDNPNIDVNNTTTVDNSLCYVPGCFLSVTFNTTNVSCKDENDGLINLTVSGGIPPYTYSWNTGNSTEDISNLTEGVYSISISDAGNCYLYDSTSISEPSSMSVTDSVLPATQGNNDGTVDLTVTGGIPPYTYIWSNGLATEDIDSLFAGIYLITITDANGCQAIDTFTITEILGISYANSSIRVSLYPNPNDGLFVLDIQLAESTALEIQLYKIDGQLLLDSKLGKVSDNYRENWDLSEFSKGIYYLKVFTPDGVIIKKILYQ